MVQLEVLREKNADCRLCSLRSQDPPVFGAGGVNATLMVVYEKPEGDDVLLGRAGEGRGGRLIRKMLAEAGFTPDEVYITPSIKCLAKRAPKVGEVRTCSAWLWAEVDALRPHSLLVLGAAPARWMGLLDRGESLEDALGERRSSEEDRLRTPARVWHSPSVLLNGGKVLTWATSTFLKSLREPS